MNDQFLEEIGLSKSQGQAYLYLLEHGPTSPPALAKVLNITRTNSYKVLDQLLELGLVKRLKAKKKTVFQPEPPTALEKIVTKSREEAMQNERKLHAVMPSMLTQYFTGNEKPGVKFYQGEKELKEIYTDQINTKEPIYIIRPDYNMDIYDFDFMSEIRHMARKAGIPRYAITPDRPKAPKNYKESDPFMLLKRTWIKAGDYTAPVEWNAYGDKIAIMSFGDEAIGMIIESPQIAESFRQLYHLLDEGLRRRADYDKLPVKANYIGATAKTR